MELVVTTPEELEKALERVIEKVLAKNLPVKTYTINEVSHMLGRSHRTIKKLVENKVIPATADGLITQTAINNYLQQ